jgi:hypothetical protein
MSDIKDEGPKLDAETLELINSELADRLARQTQAGSQIDTKAGLLVGYAVVAASFLATRHSQPVLTWLALAAFIAAAGFGVSTYAVGAYADVPDPRHLFNRYATRPKTAALAALAARRVRTFEANEPKYLRKATRWRLSLGALTVGIALMFAALYVHTDSHGQPAKHTSRSAVSLVTPASLLSFALGLSHD